MFTTIPNDFDSLYENCIFSFSDSSSDDSAVDRVVHICDSESDSSLTVKKFYSTSDYQINVAPVVRSLTYPNVVVSPTSFVDNEAVESGVVKIYIEDEEGYESDSVILTHSRHGEPTVGFVSTMHSADLTAFISRGEGEMLRVYGSPNQVISIVQRQYANGVEEAVAEVEYEGLTDSMGFATFSIVIDYLPEQLDTLLEPDLERVELILKDSDGEEIDALSYVVIDPPADATRIAWVSSYSTIEHYTFPNIESRTLNSIGATHLKLNSAPESYLIRQAIAECVTSPLLWVVTEGGYRRATMVSESVDLTAKSVLSTVQIEIEYDNE